MSGAGLWAFLVNIIGLAIIVTLIYAAMKMRPLPEPFAQFARYAVGGAAVLVLMIAIGAVLLGGGGGGIAVTIGGIFQFAIGVLVLMAVLYIVDKALDYFNVPFSDDVKFILTIVALIVILTLAAIALTGGGLGFIGEHGISFAPQRR